jgi:nucleotide-binding universal stress UspA family protein
MTNIRRILVPVDFSACSAAALKHAAAWSKAFDASLDLLHVWQIPVFTPPGVVMDPSFGEARLLELVREEAERQMNTFASEARAHGIAVRSARCEMGVPALRIVEVSQDYDLIVIGTHGRTGLSHFMLGSVAERVVRLARCPVLTVRGNASSEAQTQSADAP